MKSLDMSTVNTNQRFADGFDAQQGTAVGKICCRAPSLPQSTALGFIRETSVKYLISISLIVVGFIHVLPLSGVISAERLLSLYGIPFHEPNLEILMRHRAVLFGILGGFLILAAFKSTFQFAALVAGFTSVVSFLYLAWAVGGYNEQIGRVFIADVVALGFLVVGFVAYVFVQRKA